MKKFDVHKWNLKRRILEGRINEQFNTEVADKYEGILTFEKMFPMFSDYDDQKAVDILKKTLLPINRYVQANFEKINQFGSPKEAVQIERTGKSPELGGRPIISSADELNPQMIEGLISQLKSQGMDLSNFEADNPIDALTIHFATIAGGYYSPPRIQPLFKLKDGKVEEMQQHVESDSFPYPFVPPSSSTNTISPPPPLPGIPFKAGEDPGTPLEKDTKTMTGLADAFRDISIGLRKNEYEGIQGAEITEIKKLLDLVLQAAVDTNITTVIQRLEAMIGKSIKNK